VPHSCRNCNTHLTVLSEMEDDYEATPVTEDDTKPQNGVPDPVEGAATVLGVTAPLVAPTNDGPAQAALQSFPEERSEHDLDLIYQFLVHVGCVGGLGAARV